MQTKAHNVARLDMASHWTAASTFSHGFAEKKAFRHRDYAPLHQGDAFPPRSLRIADNFVRISWRRRLPAKLLRQCQRRPIAQ